VGVTDSDFLEVLVASGIDQVFLNLLICLVVEHPLVAFADSLGMRHCVNYFVTFEKVSHLLVDLLLFGLTPARWSPEFLCVLGTVAGCRSASIRSCACSLCLAWAANTRQE